MRKKDKILNISMTAIQLESAITELACS